MPDLSAGSTILGADTPPAVEAEESTSQNNITSTAFIPGTPECSTTFLAPTSGRVTVTVYGVLRGGSGGEEVILTFEVYRGDDETGTAIVSGASTNGARSAVAQNLAFSASKLVPGLLPQTHFVRTVHRVTGGSTADVIHRRVIVSPES